MESKRVILSLAVVLVMGMLLVETEAAFGSCYKGCLLECAIEKGLHAVVCPFSCLKKCLSPSQAPNLKDNDALYFCKLGCATAHCAGLGSIENPNEQKVEKCVDSCSETCTKTH